MTEKLTSLPKPEGPFQIGRVHLNFIDENRIDPSPLAGGKKRDVPLIIWYPTDDHGVMPPSKYISLRDLESLKHFLLYQVIPDEICDLDTNSYEAAPFSTKLQSYPVLIFNYGFTGFMESNTIMMEHLASHGYIVVSVGHPFDGVASYPDGRSIPMDVDKYKASFERSMTEEEDKKFKEYLAQVHREDIPVEEMGTLTEKSLLEDKLMNSQIIVWVDDVLFIKGILERMNGGSIKSQFTGKMDLVKGIGLFGHSYGGATSILSCSLDERFKCAINMDGGMFGGFNERFRYERPSMFMYSAENAGMNRYFYSVNDHDTYNISIKDSKHFDYSDMPFILKKWSDEVPDVFGKIDGDLMVKITNAYVLSFFDRYIRGYDTPLLERNPYSEVTFKKRLHNAQ